MMKRSDSVVPAERIEKAIFVIRGQKIMLDSDLADLYGWVAFRDLQRAGMSTFHGRPTISTTCLEPTKIVGKSRADK